MDVDAAPLNLPKGETWLTRRMLKQIEFDCTL